MGIKEDPSYVKVIDKAKFLMYSDRPIPSQMLKIGHPALALKSGCLIKNGPDIFALGEHAPGDLILVCFKLLGKRKNSYIPNNMESIREPAKAFFGHNPL
jgi:hypothetical protein